jgi:hypothetical protein
MSAQDSTAKAPIAVELADQPLSIAKPRASGLSAFKSSKPAALAGVRTLLPPLEVMKMSDVDDFVRLHPDEVNYWSDELCFTSVPIANEKGQTHLIAEALADAYLSDKQVQRYGLALASRADDRFFLCIVPTRNLVDDIWNKTNVAACRQATTLWTQSISRFKEGGKGYVMKFAEDPAAFPEPNWPTDALDEIILRAFEGRAILTEDHPGLLRKRGARQSSE